ncbi:response regulator transcription factor [Streptomyces actinomycinicus]|uniref:Response regulator transcription factor n=1 Tax=Streptomyces actinomycinicus TaxID=1695166 RepID=A0A937ESV4_9ACTN|nr:response regulator transcription factor [Streptomyces actinomycinicus]MBL1087409.1 response regulator transcription factor [Streptomyces actinomycinicus]
MIRVLLVDDQPLPRKGLRALLDGHDDVQVVGEAADGTQALRMTRTHVPDVVLTDIRPPAVDGIEMTRRIVADPALARVRVAILTSHVFDTHVFDALRAGAAGILLKDTTAEELLRAVRVIARGDALLAPSVTRTVISRLVTQPLRTPRVTGLNELTSREREAVALVARGLSTDQIADRMVISPLTAKTHIDRAKTKLHARSRAQLVGFAYEAGLVGRRSP